MIPADPAEISSESHKTKDGFHKRNISFSYTIPKGYPIMAMRPFHKVYRKRRFAYGED